jgi:5-methylcytosine-specific restriction enzyme A
MPSRPPSPCPVCQVPVPGGGRCPDHRSQRYRQANRQQRARDPWLWVYSSPIWRRLRAIVKREQPICAVPTCNRPTQDIDHIVPLSEGGAPFDRANVQGLCKPCHGRKTKADRARRRAAARSAA